MARLALPADPSGSGSLAFKVLERNERHNAMAQAYSTA
jgi:hypothetical protein